jgi:hypothetical protein
VVDVKRCIWARSNIYWDGQKLTFVPAGVDYTKQGYQGVFFKFGSLIGVSPAQKSGSTEDEKNAFDEDVRLYVPVVNATLTSSTWVSTDGTAMNWTVWDDIPYLNSSSYGGPGSVSFGLDNRYVIEGDRNTLSMYQGYLGDICQYLSTKTGVVTGDYRLPTASEMLPNPIQVNTLVGGGGLAPGYYGEDRGNAEGTVDLFAANARWVKNIAAGDVIFPASGERGNYENGGLSTVLKLGYYWSGSAQNISSGRALFFGNTDTPGYPDFSRNSGHPVRCIQN